MNPAPTLLSVLSVACLLQATGSHAGAFDAALAACARTTEFCDNVSYDKGLCKEARKKIVDCDVNTGTGVLCRLKLADVAPTQISVGMHATKCKAGAKFKREEKKIQKYLLKSTHHVPTVIGPANSAGKRFYITDHHHLSHALLVANQQKYTDVDALYACILGNRKEQSADDFWSFMVSNHLTWLDDENGQAIDPSDLEKKAPELAELKDDAYRTWSRWVRDSCGYVKAGNECVPASFPADASYFMEFKWADYLEQNLPGHEAIDKLSDDQIDGILKQAIALAKGPQAFLENLPGYSDGKVVPVKMVAIKDGCEME